MDDQPDRPVRPRPPRLAYVALQERADRWHASLRGLSDRIREWDDGRRSTSFVPASETVHLDVRRHPFVLLWPTLRTLAGLLVLVTGPRLVPLLLLAGATAAWSTVRFDSGLKRTALTAAAAAAAAALLSPPLVLLLLLALLVEDVADWACDRLVVTDRRIYRRYGVLTSHAPSIALTAIAFIDASVPPAGRLLHYGTLRLDSVAQRDAPLARLDLLPEVTAVSHEILRLRAAALPTFPQQPY